MNVTITDFSNPFCFFCKPEENSEYDCFKNEEKVQDFRTKKIIITDVNHGQYISVFWNNKWVRGIVNMESQFVIWLIDYGIYLRPNENTFYMELPGDIKILPSHVFEASIYGVVPVDKVLDSTCEIVNDVSTIWPPGAIERVKDLINNGHKTVFVPLAVLSTKWNDIVIGDLYFEINGRNINVIDKLESWPVFAQKNADGYIQNLQAFYTSRRRHRACLQKPDFPEFLLSNITCDVTIEQYNSIFNAPEWTGFEKVLEDGDSIVALSMNVSKKTYELSAADVEKYANMTVMVGGEERNALQVLLNKIKDFKMCEQYKNCKSVGRATSRIRRKL